MSYTQIQTAIIIILAAAIIYKYFNKTIKKSVQKTFAPDAEGVRLKAVLFDYTPYSIIATTDYGVVRVWNHSAEVKFLYKSDEAVGKNISELIIPEEFRALQKSGMERWRASKGSKLVGNDEGINLVAQDKNGTKFPVHLKLISIESEGFTFVGGYVRDISREEAERAEFVRQLAFAHENQRLLCIGGWEWDMDTGKVTVDEGFREVYNAPKEGDVTASELVDLIFPKDQLRVATTLNKAVKDLESYTLYYRRVQHDGELAWIEAKGKPIVKDGEDSAHMVRGTVQNIGKANETDETYHGRHTENT